tara:strand:+ start:1524 stop:2033 length:510 start_codon:yes stop_codon:yes gene_type:complete
METNGGECESWYYFIKYEGNEGALEYLEKQINKIDMFIIDELSTFDIDLEHLVSESTAKEMCKAELNSVTFHRKFDGKLKNIHLNLRKKDSNEDMIEKINDVLGLQQIEEYIDKEDEDIDSDNLDASETSDESDGEELLIPLEGEKDCCEKSEKDCCEKSEKSEKSEKD